MTRRVIQKLCATKVCVDFLAPILGDNKREENPVFGNVLSGLRWFKVA